MASSALLHPVRLRIIQTLLADGDLTPHQLHTHLVDGPIAPPHTPGERCVPAVSAKNSANRMTRLRPQAIERRPQNWLSAVAIASRVALEVLRASRTMEARWSSSA